MRTHFGQIPAIGSRYNVLTSFFFYKTFEFQSDIVILKMRARSPKSNHFFPPSQLSTCASLVEFLLSIHEIKCIQGSFSVYII